MLVPNISANIKIYSSHGRLLVCIVLRRPFVPLHFQSQPICSFIYPISLIIVIVIKNAGNGECDCSGEPKQWSWSGWRKDRGDGNCREEIYLRCNTVVGGTSLKQVRVFMYVGI